MSRSNKRYRGPPPSSSDNGLRGRFGSRDDDSGSHWWEGYGKKKRGTGSPPDNMPPPSSSSLGGGIGGRPTQSPHNRTGTEDIAKPSIPISHNNTSAVEDLLRIPNIAESVTLNIMGSVGLPFLQSELMMREAAGVTWEEASLHADMLWLITTDTIRSSRIGKLDDFDDIIKLAKEKDDDETKMDSSYLDLWKELKSGLL